MGVARRDVEAKELGVEKYRAKNRSVQRWSSVLTTVDCATRNSRAYSERSGRRAATGLSASRACSSDPNSVSEKRMKRRRGQTAFDETAEAFSSPRDSRGQTYKRRPAHAVCRRWCSTTPSQDTGVYVDGPHGRALHLNGKSELRFECKPAVVLGHAFTVSFRVNARPSYDPLRIENPATSSDATVATTTRVVGRMVYSN